MSVKTSSVFNEVVPSSGTCNSATPSDLYFRVYTLTIPFAVQEQMKELQKLTIPPM